MILELFRSSSLSSYW